MSLSLKHISLHNFRGIRGSLEWQFHEQPGFYFIQGRNEKEPSLGANGAGKSTIFADGPYWILTGKTILSQRPGNSIENWELDRAVVGGALTLRIDDQDYVIARGRNPSVLTINERTVEQSEIDKLIPLSDSALRRTLLLGQRSSMFLDLRPEEKSRLFSETLDLDVWLRAADLAGDRLRDKEREAVRLDSKIASVTGSINEVREQHATAIQKEAAFSSESVIKLQALNDTGRFEVEHLDTLKNTLGEAQERVKQISVTGTSEDELRNRRSQDRALRDVYTNLTAERRQLERRTSELDVQILVYRADDKICPECGQTITEDHAHERQLALITEKRAAMDRLFSLQEELVKVELEIGELNQSITDLEESNKNLLELKGNVRTLEQQIVAQERVFIRVMQDIKKAEDEVNPFSALCDQLETRYNQLKEQHAALIVQEDALNNEIEILKFWQKGYRDIRLEQIDSTLLELELATNRHATALGLQDWEIQFATERETKSGSVSHVFSIFLFPPGQTKPVTWDSYSGGEAQRWQLAVTFGLSEVLLSRAGIEPDIEIYDEPTGFLSQEGIDDLLECLHNRAHELQRRIYLIDHRSLERGSFDGIVTVVKDNAGVRIDSR